MESLSSGTDTGALNSAIQWVADLLTGPLATSICVLSVAALGGLLLSGRVPLRRSLAVVIGCFIILSASGIASAFIAYRQEVVSPLVIVQQPVASGPEPARRPPAPTPFDPYGFTSPGK